MSQMFAILLELVGASMVGYPTSTGEWIIAQPGFSPRDGPTPVAAKLSYGAIMNGNATDGRHFIKPQRGHEDGCISGKCTESHAEEYLQ